MEFKLEDIAVLDSILKHLIEKGDGFTSRNLSEIEEYTLSESESKELDLEYYASIINYYKAGTLEDEFFLVINKNINTHKILKDGGFGLIFKKYKEEVLYDEIKKENEELKQQLIEYQLNEKENNDKIKNKLLKLLNESGVSSAVSSVIINSLFSF